MNPKPTLIVITSYPEKGVVHSAHTVGVASYSKNLLQSIKTQYPQLQIIVLAERLAACQQCEYLDNGIIVRRCWKRNHPKSFSVWLSVLVTSLAFGLAHLWAGTDKPLQWSVAVDTFSLSLVMCAAREYTGAVWVPMMVHIIKNGNY